MFFTQRYVERAARESDRDGYKCYVKDIWAGIWIIKDYRGLGQMQAKWDSSGRHFARP